MAGREAGSVTDSISYNSELEWAGMWLADSFVAAVAALA